MKKMSRKASLRIRFAYHYVMFMLTKENAHRLVAKELYYELMCA